MNRFLFVLVSLVLAACQPSGSGTSAPAAGSGPPPAIGVRTEAVVAREWVDEIEALGTAQANESVTISAKVTETVARVNFEDGDQVRGGAILVELTGRAEVAQLKEAQAAFEETEKQLQRLQDLVQQGTVTRSAVDTQIAARDQARARREAIRARLSDRVITAPFAGVLGFRQVSEGTLLTPGTAIATLDDVETIKLDFTVPERFLAVIGVDEEIRATTAAFPAIDFTGVVRSIDSRVDPITRSVVVRAHIANQERKLKPGMLLTVRLQGFKRETLTIDEIGLLQLGRQAFVYRVDADSKAQRADVQIGSRRDGRVEIISGLAAGDVIVTDGVVKLRPGMAIKNLDMEPGATAAAKPEQTGS